jgi:hypothetical protein
MRPDDPRVLAVAAALVGLLNALRGERQTEQADELVAYPFGLERRAARELVRSGRIPTVRLGRRTYGRRSALLALVGAPPAKAPAPSASDPTGAAREAYGRPLRVVRGSR